MITTFTDTHTHISRERLSTPKRQQADSVVLVSDCIPASVICLHLLSCDLFSTSDSSCSSFSCRHESYSSHTLALNSRLDLLLDQDIGRAGVDVPICFCYCWRYEYVMMSSIEREETIESIIPASRHRAWILSLQSACWALISWPYFLFSYSAISSS
jgi:hypothetical protein